MLELYPYQQRSADKLVEILKQHPAALDASDCGAGKTFVALGVARALGCPCLVVCPKAARPNWRRVAEGLGVKLLDVQNVEMLKTGNTPWLKRGRTKKQFYWQLPKGSLVIFDEVHRASGAKTENAYMLALTKAFGLRVLMLSATVADSPLKLRAIGYLLGLHKFQDFWAWALANGCYRNPWNGVEFTLNPDLRAQHLTQVHKQIFPDRGVRVRIADLPEFPETSIHAEVYDLEAYTDEVNKIYAEMETALLNPDEEGSNPLTIMLRARQRTELLKIPLLVDMTKELVEEGRSVVIFVSFRESLRGVVAALEFQKLGKIAVIHGDQTDVVREGNVQMFLNDEARVCVTMIQCGGVSIDLDDKRGVYPRVSLITPAFSATELKQALGRIHRATSRSKSVQRILFAAGTVEEDACRAVNRKLENLSILLDNITDRDLMSGILAD